MKVLGMVGLLAACAAHPAEPLVNAAVVPHQDGAAQFPEPLLAAAPRPAIDLSSVLPDPTEEARWPLSVTAHPSLEPRFQIASALAQPGIAWTDLCHMGAQNRTLSSGRDLQTYLRAWCAAATGNTAEAFDQLAVMGTPTVAGMAPAIREDFANLLVEHGDADAAEKLLMKAKVDDLEIFDLLAASYFEVGKTADAIEINERAIDRQLRASDASQCHRLVRRIVLASPAARIHLLQPLDALGDEAARTGEHLSTDPDCKRLDGEVGCWISPGLRCMDYWVSQHLDAIGYAHLLDALQRWPQGRDNVATWIEIAHHAEIARPVPDADRLEAAALLAGFRAATCSDAPMLAKIRVMAIHLHEDPHHAPKLDRVIDGLLSATEGFTENETRAGHHCHALDLTVP